MPGHSVLSRFTQRYESKCFQFATLLRHKGVLIAFAMDQERQIFYAILDQSPESAESALDVTYWPGGPELVSFPNEIAETGFGIADQTLLPQVDDQDQAIQAGADNVDNFLSTTARFTANVPFQVLTDGRYVYLFRQAINANDNHQAYKKDEDGNNVLDIAGNPVPLVNRTILLDRFVLSGTKLQGRMEVRYQRSRSKTRPASRKDSLGAKDLDGNSFYEPTQELTFLGQVSSGRFSVLLIPTAVAEVERWQFFLENFHTARIDALSVERSLDGLFNTRGSKVFTPSQKGMAESALQFIDADARITIIQGPKLGNEFTFEAWIKPTAKPGETAPLALINSQGTPQASHNKPKAAPSVWLQQNRLLVGLGDGDTAWLEYLTSPLLHMDEWNHLAISFDGFALRFYINGALSEKTETGTLYLDGVLQTTQDDAGIDQPLQEAFSNRPLQSERYRIKKIGHSSSTFCGCIDEVRLWDRCRHHRELEADLHHRLTGLEPGLVRYWRFDEAIGDTVFDQTNNDTKANLQKLSWITSDAPIGENAAINRNSFQIVDQQSNGDLLPRSIASGFTSLLYFQQMNTPSGYDGQDKPLKQAGRVMLAFATKATDSNADNTPYVASLDFGVSATGKIAQVPDRLPLDLVTTSSSSQKSINEQLDEIVAASEQVRVLEEAVVEAQVKMQEAYDEWQQLRNGATNARVKVVSVTSTTLSAGYGSSTSTNRETNHYGIGRHYTGIGLAALTATKVRFTISVPEQLQVKVGSTIYKEGEDQSISWPDYIEVQRNPDYFEVARLKHQLAVQEKEEKQLLLDTAQTNLANLQSVIQTGAEISMPLVHLDASGLSVSAALLGFAWTEDTPLLFDSATGSLALYFRGTDDQFFAAYYTTLTERASYPLIDDNNTLSVICSARSSDPGTDQIQLTISDANSDQTCDIRITGLGIEENWSNVPRDIHRFARVLNGKAGHYQNNKLVGYREMIGMGLVNTESGQLSLEFSAGLRRALDKDAEVMLGTTLLRVIEAAEAGASSIAVSSGIQAFPSEPQPAFFMEYNYFANASTTKVPNNLVGGSVLLRAVVVDGSNPANIVNQTVSSASTLKSKWTAAAPGSTLVFNGVDTLATTNDSNQLKQFDSKDDLTMEAWVRPEQHAVGAGLFFDGQNDYIELTQDITLGSTFTLEAWIYPEGNNNSLKGIIGSQASPEILSSSYAIDLPAFRPPSLWIENNNKVVCGFGDGLNWNALKTGTVLATGEWNHVAATFNGSWYRIFVNGALAAETADFSGKSPLPHNNVNSIGTSRNYFFRGRINEVRIWKRARSQDQILANMHQQLTGNENKLAGYWYLQDGAVQDLTSHSNHGIVRGNPVAAISPLDRSRIIQHHSTRSSYALGIERAELSSALSFNGSDEYIDLNPGVTLGDHFTLEAWIYPDAGDDALHGFLGSRQSSTKRPPSLWIVEKNKIHGGFGDGSNWNAFTTAEPVLATQTWNHVAMTFDGDWLRLYVNGNVSFETQEFSGRQPKANPINRIGRTTTFFPGRMDEVRIWSRALLQAELLANMNRRLAGNESGLAGYWHFQDGETWDYSRHNNHGVKIGEPTLAAAPLPAYRCFAGVNGKFVRSKNILPAGNWAHLAAVYVQDYSLKFNGNWAYLDCGNDESLNINADLTIEAFLTLSSAQQTHQRYIIKRGPSGESRRTGTAKEAYALYTRIGGKLVFRFQDEAGEKQEFVSSAPVQTDTPLRIRVTRKLESVVYDNGANELPITFNYYRITFYIGDKAPEEFWYAVDEDTRAAAEAYDKGQANRSKIGKASQDTPEIARTDSPTLIGYYFEGILNEVSIWNEARKPQEESRNGLVSWWRFEEREGTKANDSIGQNHAFFDDFTSKITWIESPTAPTTALTLYHNDGGPLLTEEVDDISKYLITTDQFTLGGLVGKRDMLKGELEEVRIWQTARTREQIEDNLFRRINGELDDLIAYYTFDTKVQGQVSDFALRGNDLLPQGDVLYQLSTAPIGDDAPIVRSALAGLRTPFSGFIDSTPAVAEYGDMQYDSEQMMIGVFKRCYGFVRNEHWHLVTGYKVGDMLVEWVGQVQFAPELMGFIEGAPPVPSENLTQPSVELVGDLDDYNETSVIEFTQAEETTFTYSASKERDYGLEVESSIGKGFESKTQAGNTIGYAILAEITKTENKLALKHQYEAMWGWSSEASIGTTRTKGKTTSLELRGRLASAEEVEKEVFQWRRFIPDNIGLALVQSETADVFALRLKYNNALISYSMRPNPDIPKDWNILHFPINPRYTKQGTLDGKIGPRADVDYPNALQYSTDSSYFKPIEAYALKNNIQKKKKALETYYDQFDAQDKGGKKAHFPDQDSIDLAEATELRKKMNRDLVNTYVWSADGGLYAESNETMEVQTETAGGSYEFTGKGGVGGSIQTTIFGAAIEFELNALFVGHHKVAINKSKESNSSFQMGVNLDKVERDLYMRDENKIVLLDKSDPLHPRPIKHPYKVDAYRFMTFYLEESSDHFDTFFEKVVDPIWIEQSDSPAAIALRETRQEGKKPPCWRIMHRVTYVSRVLPPLDNSAPPSLERALQTLDIDSNYELIKQLEPYIVNQLTSYPDFTAAVRRTIDQNLPELKPHTEEVIKYMSLYFGISPTQMPASTAAEDDPVDAIAPANQPPLVTAGPDQVLGLNGSIVETMLEAVVVDDRLERSEAIFVTWEKVSGPGTVDFSDTHLPSTKATFYQRGRYELKLTANDGEMEGENSLIITVNEPPLIRTKNTLDTDVLNEVLLPGEIIDHGLGHPETGTITVSWQLAETELGRVTFDPPNTAQTKASFDNPGSYLLQLKVDNGSFEATSELMVSVAARVNRGIQALYTFEEGTGNVVAEVSGVNPALALNIPSLQHISWEDSTQPDQKRLELKEATLLTSAGSSEQLITSLKSSNEITLEAWVKPALPDVPGFARILSLSGGPWARNFTLGQSGLSFHFNLRTSTTNDNASDKALSGGTDVLENLTQVVCTRSADGQVKMYIDGAVIASRKIDGDFSTWPEDFQLAVGNEIGGGTDRAWTGELHLLAIYNRALAEEEITQNFNFGANVNLPPAVSAGGDIVEDWQEFDWSLAASGDQKRIISLNGSVKHDRPSSNTSVLWEQVGGPKTGVLIADAQSETTSVEIMQKGSYIFRLKAQDGEMTNSDEKTVSVNVPPRVEIENVPAQNGVHLINLAHTGTQVEIDLVAKLLDSGLAEQGSSQSIAFQWSTDDPGNVQLQGANTMHLKATFMARGVYQLQLEVDNGKLQTTFPINVKVDETPIIQLSQPPVITLPDNELSLECDILDSGLAATTDELTYKWEQLAGSGTVNFDDENVAITTASFDASGLYQLRLTVQNPNTPALLFASAELTVTINSAPVVEAGRDLVVGMGLEQDFATALLDGTVSDDGLPENPGKLSLEWRIVRMFSSRLPNPGDEVSLDVTSSSGTDDNDLKVYAAEGQDVARLISSPQHPDYIEAQFSRAGVYTLLLTADDGAVSTGDTLSVKVESAAVVDMVPILKVTVPTFDTEIPLSGMILDTGLGDDRPLASLSLQWKVLNGPSSPVFASEDALETAITVGQRGLYSLQFSADNGLGYGVGEAVVHLLVHQAPAVRIERNAISPSSWGISCSIEDDGLGDPAEQLSFQWGRDPGFPDFTITSDPNQPRRIVADFPSAGQTYRVGLTITNGSVDPHGVPYRLIHLIEIETPPLEVGEITVEPISGGSATLQRRLRFAIEEGFSHSIQVTWRKVGGSAANVTFDSTDDPLTTIVTTSAPGIYQLEARITDGDSIDITRAIELDTNIS